MKWAGECSESLALEGNLYAYQNRVRGIVQQCVSVVEACDKDATIGDLAARQKRAMEIIKSMRYGPENKDYVWINDMNPTMIMHPYKPQLDGKALGKVADPDGKQLFVEFVNKCKADGAGFVTYKWPKPGSEAPVPKISYVALYKPWNWVMGTGVFVTDEDQNFLARLEQFASGQPFTFSVETDPASCNFGKFLASSDTAKLCAEFPELSRSLSACREPYEKLYQLATVMSDAISGGDMEKALYCYKNELQPTMNKFKKHLDEAIDAEAFLQAGADKANTIYASATQPALAEVRGLLKDASRIANQEITTDAAMLTAAERTQRNVTAVGVVAVVLGVLLTLVISRGITRMLTKIITGLSEGAEQVNDAAGQVSSASQQSAEGASEQASSLEETSAALEEMSSMTRTNAEHAKQANELSEQARTAAESGNLTMDQFEPGDGGYKRIVQPDQ